MLTINRVEFVTEDCIEIRVDSVVEHLMTSIKFKKKVPEIKNTIQGWQNGPEVKSTGCFSRNP